MKTELVEVIYIVFLAAGSAMIILLLYLRSLTKKAFRVIPRLIAMNEECEYDLKTFLAEAEGLMEPVGIRDFFYTITYEGSHVERPKVVEKDAIERTLRRTGYSVYVGIVPKNPHGEKKYTSMIIFQTLFLLIEMDVLLRIKAANEALYNFSRLQTFVLHDVKNVAQFIQTMLFNVEKVKGFQREHTFIEYLRSSAPALSLRTNRIVGMLKIGDELNEEEGAKQDIEVRKVLDELISFYQLKGEVTGHALLFGEEYKFVTILDCIMKNVHEKYLVEPELVCFVYIRDDDGVVKILVHDTGSPVEEIERVFEPFYTTKRTGLGIGLFQARHLVESLNGNIKIENGPDGVRTTITLPRGTREEFEEVLREE